MTDTLRDYGVGPWRAAINYNNKIGNFSQIIYIYLDISSVKIGLTIH